MVRVVPVAGWRMIRERYGSLMSEETFLLESEVWPGPSSGVLERYSSVCCVCATKSGQIRPNEYVAIILLLFFCISNLFREHESYLTIT